MSEAAGQLADRLHLLRLAKFLFGVSQGLGAGLLLGHIAPVGVDDAILGEGVPGDPSNTAVLLKVAVLETAEILPCERRRPGLVAPREIVGMQQGAIAASDDILGFIAKQSGPGRADGPEITIRPDDDQQVARVVPDTVALPRALGYPLFEGRGHLPQPGFDGLERGDVVDRPDQSISPAGAVLRTLAPPRDPTRLASVGANDLAFAIVHPALGRLFRPADQGWRARHHRGVHRPQGHGIRRG